MLHQMLEPLICVPRHPCSVNFRNSVLLHRDLQFERQCPPPPNAAPDSAVVNASPYRRASLISSLTSGRGPSFVSLTLQQVPPSFLSCVW